MSLLTFVLSSYLLNGTWLGYNQWTSQFQLCGAPKNDGSRWYRWVGGGCSGAGSREATVISCGWRRQGVMGGVGTCGRARSGGSGGGRAIRWVADAG